VHDLNLRRGLATGPGIFSAVVIGIALNSGDRANAVGPPPDGNYTFNQAGVSGVTWTITALCDQVNGSRYYKDYSNPDIQADFCALNIVSATDEQVSREDKLHNYGGRARLTSGRWTFQVGVPDGVSCPGGGTAPSTETYAFDDGTLSGAGDEQAAVFTTAGRSPAHPDPALPVAVQRRCHLLLSLVPRHCWAA
jgi:hypothetical protein